MYMQILSSVLLLDKLNNEHFYNSIDHAFVQVDEWEHATFVYTICTPTCMYIYMYATTKFSTLNTQFATM